MTTITQDMRDVIHRSMLAYKATVMVYDDEHLVFMDQASSGSEHR